MRTIRRPEQFEPLVRQLAENPHPISKRSIFATMRELLCFAAVLGFNEEVRTPVGDRTKEIDGRIFENSQQAIDLIYLLALAGTRDAGILQPEREEEMIRVFEEYAASGLAVLDRWLFARPDGPRRDQHRQKAPGPVVRAGQDRTQVHRGRPVPARCGSVILKGGAR